MFFIRYFEKLIALFKDNKTLKREFFISLRELEKSFDLNPEYIRVLETKAIDCNVGWKNEAYALLLGLDTFKKCNSSSTSAESAETLQSKLGVAKDKLLKTNGSSFRLSEYFLVLAVACSALLAINSNLMRGFIFSNIFYSLFFALTFLVVVLFLNKYSYEVDGSKKIRTVKEKILCSFFVTLLFTCLLWGLSRGITGTLINVIDDLAKRDWIYIKKKNEEYPFIKKFLKDNYDIDLILVEPRENMYSTYFSFGDRGSPASMESYNGFCALYYSHFMLDDWSDVMDEELKQHFHQISLVHEAGHCVSFQRDFNNFSATLSQPVIFNSVYEEKRKNVHDLETFIAAGVVTQTRLWREVIADLFALGFAKIHFPEQSSKLADKLIGIRTRDKTDLIHQTTCWLIYARESNITPPTDDRQIYDWVINLANTASDKNQNLCKHSEQFK